MIEVGNNRMRFFNEMKHPLTRMSVFMTHFVHYKTKNVS